MNTIQHGLRNYRNHEIVNKAPAAYELDFKTDNRRQEESRGKRDQTRKESVDEFREILRREMEK